MTARGLALVSDLSVNFLLMWCLMPQETTGEPASGNTSRLRRSAARSFFDTVKVLGISDANPAKSVEFPTRSERYVKALSDQQMAQLQPVARMSVDDIRTPAALALVMSRASTKEMAFVSAADVDLPRRRGGGTQRRLPAARTLDHPPRRLVRHCRGAPFERPPHQRRRRRNR